MEKVKRKVKVICWADAWVKLDKNGNIDDIIDIIDVGDIIDVVDD